MKSLRICIFTIIWIVLGIAPAIAGTMDDYANGVAGRLRNNFFEPKTNVSVRPIVRVDIDKSGLVIDATLLRASASEPLNQAVLKAAWFSAPFDKLPAGEAASFSAQFDSPITARFLADQDTKRPTEFEGLDIWHNVLTPLDKGNLRQVDQYFTNNRMPKDVRFVLDKNIWMQLMRAMKIPSSANFLQLLASLPHDWIGDEIQKSAKTAEKVAASLDSLTTYSSLEQLSDRKEIIDDFSALLARVDIAAFGKHEEATEDYRPFCLNGLLKKTNNSIKPKP